MTIVTLIQLRRHLVYVAVFAFVACIKERAQSSFSWREVSGCYDGNAAPMAFEDSSVSRTAVIELRQDSVARFPGTLAAAVVPRSKAEAWEGRWTRVGADSIEVIWWRGEETYAFHFAIGDLELRGFAENVPHYGEPRRRTAVRAALVACPERILHLSTGLSWLARSVVSPT